MVAPHLAPTSRRAPWPTSQVSQPTVSGSDNGVPYRDIPWQRPWSAIGRCSELVTAAGAAVLHIAEDEPGDIFDAVTAAATSRRSRWKL
jgi:hypothetical protein